MLRSAKAVAFINIAKAISSMSTCVSRSVGCVLIDEHSRIIGTGYNGIPSGFAHQCLFDGCQRGEHKPGENLSACLAIHAEANALMHCSDVKKISRVFLYGASPCFECAKMLSNSSMKELYFNELYGCDPSLQRATLELFINNNVKLFIVDDKKAYPIGVDGEKQEESS